MCAVSRFSLETAVYRSANLAGKMRRKVHQPSSERLPLAADTRIQEVWNMDFISDSLANGRRRRLQCIESKVRETRGGSRQPPLSDDRRTLPAHCRS